MRHGTNRLPNITHPHYSTPGSAVPKLTIYQGESSAEDLPPLCMVCGEAADLARPRTFRYRPIGGIMFLLLGLPGLLIYGIITHFTGSKIRVEVPLCHGHQSHWAWRGWAIWGGLAALMMATAGGIFLCTQFNLRDPYPGAVALACLFGFLSWLISVVVLQSTAIRCTIVTRDYAEFKGVHGAFVEAADDLEDEREAAYRASRRR